MKKDDDKLDIFDDDDDVSNAFDSDNDIQASKGKKATAANAGRAAMAVGAKQTGKAHPNNATGANGAPRVKKPMKKRQVAVVSLCIVLAIVVIFCSIVTIIIHGYLDKINIVDHIIDPNSTHQIALVTPNPSNDDDVYTLAPGETPVPYDPPTLSTETPMLSDDVYSVLLIGSDSRDVLNDRGNSDVMMLVSLNAVTKEIWLTSFQRDTYINIPGVGYNRLNSAYMRGGPELLLRTLLVNYRVSIDKYALVNFETFPQIVDAMGGVTIEIKKEELPHMPVGINEAGIYNLNGKEALAYTRIRRVGTDFGRTQRQRLVMTRMIEKLKQLSISELMTTLDVLLPSITTNVPKTDMISLIMSSPSYISYEIKELRIPMDGTYEHIVVEPIMQVLGLTDIETNIQAIRSSVFGGVNLD